jgi:hypothetical protein
MNRHPLEFRCDVCRRIVDDETRTRARRAWQPLIICDCCLRDAIEPVIPAHRALVLAPAA